MKKKAPLLVNFNSKRNHSPYFLGIQSIGAYCLSMGNRVTLLSVSGTPEENANQILSNNPDLIGFSVNYSSEQISGETLKVLRAKTNIPVVLGGPSVTYSTQKSSILSQPADLFVKGEGEIPFQRIVADLEGVASGRVEILGVFRRGLFKQEVSRVPLSNMPSPHPLDTSVTHIYWETARGCAFNCTYCAHPAKNDFFRVVPEDRLAKEVEIFRKMPALRAIYITDPVLGGPKSNTKKVLGLLQRLPEKFVTASLRPEYLDDEIIELLKKTKIGWLDIGVQTIHPELDSFRRNDSESLKRLSLLKENGIGYNLDLIFGIPGDSPEGYLTSLKTAIEIFQPSSLKLFRLKIYDGTRLHEIAEEKRWAFHPVTREVESIPGFSRDKLSELSKLSADTVELYNFLERNNWSGRESRLRNIDTFLRFNNFSGGSPSEDKIKKFLK